MKKNHHDIDWEDMSDLQPAFQELAAEQPPTEFLEQVMARAAQEPLLADSQATDIRTDDRPCASDTEVPALSRATVLRLDRGRRRRWLAPLMTAPSVAALAACLILSLAANVWFGSRLGATLGPTQVRHHSDDQRQEFRALLTDFKSPEAALGLHAYLFQSVLNNGKPGHLSHRIGLEARTCRCGTSDFLWVHSASASLPR